VSDLDWLDDTSVAAVDDHGLCVCGATHHSERHQKCPRCGQVFNGTTIADAHLVKQHPPTPGDNAGTGIYAGCPCERGMQYHHYCLTSDAMRDRGWWTDDYGVWHTARPTDNPWRVDG
jgi:hypothetical protein